jgi:UDP-galactopyranose mutase
MFEDYHIIVVDCGLSGCVIAERFANLNALEYFEKIFNKKEYV